MTVVTGTGMVTEPTVVRRVVGCRSFYRGDENWEPKTEVQTLSTQTNSVDSVPKSGVEVPSNSPFKVQISLKCHLLLETEGRSGYHIYKVYILSLSLLSVCHPLQIIQN